MTSAYILEEAMSSKDDVITFSSYQGVQDLESAMMTSEVMSSQSAVEQKVFQQIEKRSVRAGSAKMTSAESVDGLATMTSVVTKLKLSAVVKRSARDKATTYRKNIQSQATVQPAGTSSKRNQQIATVILNQLLQDNQQSLKLEKESVDGISHMLKRNQQVHSFKCVPVAVLQTTKEELVIKREFKKSAVAIKMSAED
ncbi:hypothetical protein F511_42635 [Dorcoceras hygrometricum]|uniref:Uncharacterized protein n=1 Tax=Dorcoceras hygrometricum TaxID=472368 RepID=A0A2Z7ACM3_9LAMI|nr:hypothetical protein F511_42635 [Dorcoceras hygrometricum]